MTDRGRLPAQPPLQAAVAFTVAALGWLVDLPAALVLLTAMAVVWPPAVAWLPLRPWPVLRAYVPFALGWLLFVIVYLRVLAWCGAPLAPQPMLQQLAAQGSSLPGFWPQVVGIAVLAPLAEELLFRGYLFTALHGLLSRTATHLLTAAAFGLVHGVGYALPIGLLSLLFARLRERERALAPAVFAHAVHNGLTVLVTVSWPAHLDLLYPQ
ncbi:MAG: CPBP family intramembrane metalloprotease [Planctomycetes bacterium]|nr:CPBP family intramembrane metalloprotease [Planctomycetota bacterium]